MSLKYNLLKSIIKSESLKKSLIAEYSRNVQKKDEKRRTENMFRAAEFERKRNGFR